ncbi:glutamate-1-semialdehyde 2,1-aminomutase [Limnochorda pilosa]|uniref:Glutamate-1-semialdehyde 2,1-aminomutase n=1 Tax=Limnochorda pilosa TaxID=1555112 RepID=A0A0K2SPF5_LIMPI|nr:glutamate-1-semialdehyde 2,1-aminomutase [Limnochorda pilosa]BAS28986.1 glutamate-1-semialdehyde aminotransferase [Limnochorda pilosa]
MSRSEELFARARRWIPGGVNSPVRAFRAVGGTPPFVARGEGARLFDVDGRSYIDYVGSYGPLILGHAHPRVVEAVCQAARLGATFGAPTEGEVALARVLVEAVPSLEEVRLVSSGTEATMSAIRLSRAATGRSGVVKFRGGYHGHVDALLVESGSGASTLGVPSSPGVPAAVVEQTHLLPYNDLAAAQALFDRSGAEIACVIVEPVAGNMGVVPPEPGFLEGLRRLTREHGAVLIFDEVITGFRVAYGGAQARLGVTPDLTCLGKVIGGGMPIGAYGGLRELMEQVAPAGPVYQAGTLAGNPVAVAAGLRTLEILREEDPYPALEEVSARLADGLAEAARDAGICVQVQRVGSLLGLFFTEAPVRDAAGVAAADGAAFRRFFHAMLDAGVYLAPSPWEAWFVSTAHRAAEIDATVEAARRAFRIAAERA